MPCILTFTLSCQVAKLFEHPSYVVSVNEFSATCNWQVIGVQFEQNWCKDRTLRKAVMLGSARTSVIAHVCVS